MKVLSIREPYASLILSGVKKIETRSWKTNYRGELYIHASLGKRSPSPEVMKLVSHTNPGYILCKAKLVDCIYMTNEYVEQMKKDNPTEYLCGDYQEGRYAWVLDGVEPVEPILVKGHLGIWNYDEKKIKI